MSQLKVQAGNKDKKLVANTLLISTIPVIVSCIAQMWFGWYGPFTTLNGLIVWFQREPSYSSATGLFNNPNYLDIYISKVELCPSCLKVSDKLMKSFHYTPTCQ